MKSLSSGMLSDLAAELLTLNTCVLITRRDGTVFSWTDCDQPITVSGVTYQPVDGYSATSNQGKSDFTVDNLEVFGYLASAAITESDVLDGRWDYATVRIFMVNRNSVANGTYEMREGWLGQVRIMAPGVYHAEIRGLSQVIQNNIGSLITPTCRWTFCDHNSAGPVANSHCGLSVATYTTSGVAVTTTYSTQEFAASSLTEATGWFNNGYLTWSTGPNAGVSCDVQGFSAGGIILMQLPVNHAISIGDTFSIVSGCLKRFGPDCVIKYSNGAAHGGFPYLPGLDKIVRPAGV